MIFLKPPLEVEDGSTVKTANLFPFDVKYFPKVSIKLLLPAPGGPVMPKFKVNSYKLSEKNSYQSRFLTNSKTFLGIIFFIFTQTMKYLI